VERFFAMRVLITGGTGLIGQPLAAALVNEGYEVIVLTRNPQQHPMPPNVQLEKWDGITTTGWGRLADGAEGIINLAGEGIADGRWSKERKQRILNSRVAVGKAVIGAIRQATRKPKVLVQASGVDYYGARNDEVLIESASPGSTFLARVCFDWEASTAAATDMGLRRPVLRTSVVLSNDGGAFPKMVLPFHFFAGGPLGNGKQWLPWIHIEDQVRAILFLLRHDNASGPFNLAAPDPITNKKFSQLVGKAMGRPALLPAPAIALKAVLGEMSALLLDSRRAVPQRLLEYGFTFKYDTAEAAIENLLK
jgi:uncharacterized protein (TIGR01777 family)